MKILYHHRTMADGAEGIHIRELVRALRANGHDVRVAALAGDPTRVSHTRGFGVGALRRVIPSFAYELAEIMYNEIGYRRVLAAIGTFKPDMIYDRYNLYSTAALRAARRARLPLLLEVNAPMAYERSTYEHLRLKFGWLAKRFERRIFQGADRIFVVSTPLKRYLVEVIGIDPDKIVILPNGVDPEVFVPAPGEAVRRRYGVKDRLIIGFVGILRPWHGVDLLLEAFKDVRKVHSDTHLLVVGDGPIRPQLESLARDLGLDDGVTFTGRISHTDVVAHVAAMDVCVSPHATFYASPMKLLEYMAMAKAVVAPASENIRDIIADEETGLLFDPGQARSLALVLRRLIADEGLRCTLGQRARSRVVQRFNWRRNAECVLEHATMLAEGRVAYSG